MKLGLLIVLVGILTCCVSPAYVLLKYDPVRYDPPRLYYTLWDQVEKCSGFSEDPTRMVFYSVARMPRSSYLGLWHGDHSVWVLRGWELNHRVIKHEMLHELLNLAGENNGHSHPAFGPGKCNLRDVI